MSLPIVAAVVVVGTARGCAMLPDKMEKYLFVKEHRTWTHYLITCLISGVVLGLIVYGLGYGSSELLHSRMCTHGAHHACDRHARGVIKNVYELGTLGAYLVGMGAMIGAVVHTLADACTLSGTPLLGPFSKKDRHLMPEGMRTRTGEIKTTLLRGKPEPFQMTAGERRWLIMSYVTTAAILFLHFAPYIKEVSGRS
jgi:hypothetical protein